MRPNLSITLSLARKAIPKALREQVWIQYIGYKFRSNCYIHWCRNKITPFSFEVGHDIPHSKGGTLDIDNLKPLCPQCNRSMSNKYTIEEFNILSKPVRVKKPSPKKKK